MEITSEKTQRLANNEYVTYGELIEMHKDFLKNKRIARESGEATKVAYDTCQYNQLFIDDNHDPKAKVHTAKEAWLLVRNFSCVTAENSQ